MVLRRSSPKIPEPPAPSHKATKPSQVPGDTHALLNTPVQCQRCPKDTVHQTLLPGPNLQSLGLRVITLLPNRRSSPLLAQHILPPQNAKLQDDMREPSAHTPQIPLIDTTPPVHKLSGDHALGRQEPPVFQNLVNRVRNQLQDRDRMDVRVLRRVTQCLRTPSPQRNEPEQTQRVPGFRAEGREGQERRRLGLLSGRGCRRDGFLVLVVCFVLLDARHQAQAGLEGDPWCGCD